MNMNRGSKVLFVHDICQDTEEDFHYPLVSFVIPVLNSKRTLERCLRSIISQNYPKVEILIIDGGSTDGSVEIAKRYGAKVYHFKGPLGNARKLGIDNSAGELIALWDSDAYIPHSRWLLRSINVMSKFPKASTLWIRTTPPPNAGIIARAYDWFSWATMLIFARKHVGFWGGGISIFKKKAIVDVGGITRDIDTGEDYDLARKLAMKGYEVIHYHDPVYHDSHNTLTEFVRKDFRRARNFKKVGLTSLTGVPLREFLLVNLIATFTSLKNLFVDKKAYFVMVPILQLLRLITYLICYLLS